MVQACSTASAWHDGLPACMWRPCVSRLLLTRVLSHLLAPGQVAACGKSSLAALADWKPPAVTPLAEPKHRAPKPGGGQDEHGEAFSAAAVHSLFDR